jgi:REP element-mobilizing transposase RayT
MPSVHHSFYTHRKGCVEAFFVQVVFSTKYRCAVFTPAMADDLRDSFAQTCRHHHATLLDFGAGHPYPKVVKNEADAKPLARSRAACGQPPEADHVHLVIRYPGTLSIPLLVRDLKRNSYAAVWWKHPSIRATYIRVKQSALRKIPPAKRSDTTLWSPSYFAESMGRATLQTVRDYAHGQKDQAPKS